MSICPTGAAGDKWSFKTVFMDLDELLRKQLECKLGETQRRIKFMNVEADVYTAATNEFSDILESSRTFLFRFSILKFISFIKLYYFFHSNITNLVKSIESVSKKI